MEKFKLKPSTQDVKYLLDYLKNSVLKCCLCWDNMVLIENLQTI